MRWLLIIIFLISCSGMSALRKLTLQTGASVTIPCHYDLKYILHKKYWCYDKRSHFNRCRIQAYANKTEGKVTVTDNPSESLFTVTMRDLQEENTGMYWCAVKIGGLLQLDVTEDLYITVTADPEVSVLKSRVRCVEGGSVTVQCLYNAAHKNTQKQWCRSKDRWCYREGRTETPWNSAVQISDDRRSSFRMDMTGLKKSDAGWYWCSVGDLVVPVHLIVTASPAVDSTGACSEEPIQPVQFCIA